jgi:hypothetical protein
MRKIIYEKPEGGVAVVTPAINTHPVRENITEAQAEQRAWDRLPKDAISPRFVDSSVIPTDRTFRNAWKADLSVDMEKAKEIHRQRLRELRKPILEALDVEFMRALEKGDVAAQASLAAKKQALRDVTADPSIANASTPEELKVAVPSVLQ